MAFFRDIKEALTGMWSLLIGLKVTGYYFTKPLVTVHYPRKTVDNISTYRGHVELVAKPTDTNTPKCIICGMCVKNCPSGCLEIKHRVEEEEVVVPPKEGEENAEPKTKKKKTKIMENFYLNYNLCSLCGLCASSCPVKSLKFSDNVYLAGFKREDFEFDLLERMRAQKPKPKAEAGEG